MINYPQSVFVISRWLWILLNLTPIIIALALYGTLPKRRRQWCMQHKLRALGVLLLVCAACVAGAKEVEPPKPVIEFTFRIYQDLNTGRLHPQGWKIIVEPTPPAQNEGDPTP